MDPHLRKLVGSLGSESGVAVAAVAVIAGVLAFVTFATGLSVQLVQQTQENRTEAGYECPDPPCLLPTNTPRPPAPRPNKYRCTSTGACVADANGAFSSLTECNVNCEEAPPTSVPRPTNTPRPAEPTTRPSATSKPPTPTSSLPKCTSWGSWSTATQHCVSLGQCNAMEGSQVGGFACGPATICCRVVHATPTPIPTVTPEPTLPTRPTVTPRPTTAPTRKPRAYGCDLMQNVCVANTNGAFTSLTECNANCGEVTPTNTPRPTPTQTPEPTLPIRPSSTPRPPTPKPRSYACNQSRGICEARADGPFSSLTECNANCGEVVPTSTPRPTPTQATYTCVSRGGACYTGPSSCDLLGRKSVSGTCSGIGICCGDRYGEDKCDRGNRYCASLESVGICKIDRSGYVITACAEGTRCDGGACVSDANTTNTCVLNGYTCHNGISACSVMNLNVGTGSCTNGGVCCGSPITDNRCDRGLSYCADEEHVQICRADKSGYDTVACADGKVCPDGGVGCVVKPTPTPLTPGGQCYFGASTCDVLGRSRASGCSSCPQGTASCCGALLPTPTPGGPACTPYLRECVDGLRLKIYDATCTTARTIHCADGQVCDASKKACVTATEGPGAACSRQAEQSCTKEGMLGTQVCTFTSRGFVSPFGCDRNPIDCGTCVVSVCTQGQVKYEDGLKKTCNDTETAWVIDSCPSGQRYTADGVCEYEKKADGQVCADGGECESGNCVAVPGSKICAPAGQSLGQVGLGESCGSTGYDRCQDGLVCAEGKCLVPTGGVCQTGSECVSSTCVQAASGPKTCQAKGYTSGPVIMDAVGDTCGTTSFGTFVCGSGLTCEAGRCEDEQVDYQPPEGDPLMDATYMAALTQQRIDNCIRDGGDPVYCASLVESVEEFSGELEATTAEAAQVYGRCVDYALASGKASTTQEAVTYCQEDTGPCIQSSAGYDPELCRELQLISAPLAVAVATPVLAPVAGSAWTSMGTTLGTGGTYLYTRGYSAMSTVEKVYEHTIYQMFMNANSKSVSRAIVSIDAFVRRGAVQTGRLVGTGLEFYGTYRAAEECRINPSGDVCLSAAVAYDMGLVDYSLVDDALRRIGSGYSSAITDWRRAGVISHNMYDQSNLDWLSLSDLTPYPVQQQIINDPTSAYAADIYSTYDIPIELVEDPYFIDYYANLPDEFRSDMSEAYWLWDDMLNSPDAADHFTGILQQSSFHNAGGAADGSSGRVLMYSPSALKNMNLSPSINARVIGHELGHMIDFGLTSQSTFIPTERQLDLVGSSEARQYYFDILFNRNNGNLERAEWLEGEMMLLFNIDIKRLEAAQLE